MAAFASHIKIKFKTVGVGPHRPEGEQTFSLWTPAFFHCALSLASYVSETPAFAAKSRRCAVPLRSGYKTRKNTLVFPPLLRRDF